VTPLDRLSKEAEVNVGEVGYSSGWNDRPSVRRWFVNAHWKDYHGADLTIEREGTTVREAAASVLEVKAIVDVEWRGSGTDRRADNERRVA
jgi:hypothetical protein